MKTKITIWSIAFIMSLTAVYSQTHVYNETTSSGMWFQGTNGAEVSNPVSDSVNSSAKCAKSATDGNWQQIQYFPTFTPASGDKLFISIYNPNNAGPGQIQFEYSTDVGTWHSGGDVAYNSGSVTGWVEYSVDLTAHIGKQIFKVIIMPAGDNSSAVYLDNIYVAQSSMLAASNTNMIVYDETTLSGMWFQGTNGAEVSNPVSDSVNSSAKCAKSATDGNWQQIQYFPTFTPASGDKLFISIYNPNNAGPGQIQFEYSTDVGTWHSGGDVAYNSGSVTGWVEYSVDLTAHIGKQIFKVIIMPAGDNSSAVYLDNIYFAKSSTLSTNSFEVKKESMAFISSEGKIKFLKEQSNTKIIVYDLMGRLILNEKINGKESANSLNIKGIYILRIETNDGAFSQKSLFR